MEVDPEDNKVQSGTAQPERNSETDSALSDHEDVAKEEVETLGTPENGDTPGNDIASGNKCKEKVGDDVDLGDKAEKHPVGPVDVGKDNKVIELDTSLPFDEAETSTVLDSTAGESTPKRRGRPRKSRSDMDDFITSKEDLKKIKQENKSVEMKKVSKAKKVAQSLLQPMAKNVAQTVHPVQRKSYGRKTDFSDRWLIPFKEGWMREVVQRYTSDPGKSRMADVYYKSPTNKKLRSMVEVEKYLSDTDSTLEKDMFTFFKDTIHEPPMETFRIAGPGRGSLGKKNMSPATSDTPSPKRKRDISPTKIESPLVSSPTKNKTFLKLLESKTKSSPVTLKVLTLPSGDNKLKKVVVAIPSDATKGVPRILMSSNSSTGTETTKPTTTNVINIVPIVDDSTISSCEGTTMNNSNVTITSDSSVKAPMSSGKTPVINTKAGVTTITKSASNIIVVSKSTLGTEPIITPATTAVIVPTSSAVTAAVNAAITGALSVLKPYKSANVVAKKHTGKRGRPALSDIPVKRVCPDGTRGLIPRLRLCDLECPHRMGIPPSLQCEVCMCMYHPECLGQVHIPHRHNFICTTCRQFSAAENRRHSPVEQSFMSVAPPTTINMPPPPPLRMVTQTTASNFNSGHLPPPPVLFQRPPTGSILNTNTVHTGVPPLRLGNPSILPVGAIQPPAVTTMMYGSLGPAPTSGMYMTGIMPGTSNILSTSQPMMPPPPPMMSAPPPSLMSAPGQPLLQTAAATMMPALSSSLMSAHAQSIMPTPPLMPIPAQSMLPTPSMFNAPSNFPSVAFPTAAVTSNSVSEDRLSGQVITLPPSILNKVNSSQPIYISVEGKRLEICTNNFTATPNGIRLLLPPNSLPASYLGGTDKPLEAKMADEGETSTPNQPIQLSPMEDEAAIGSSSKSPEGGSGVHSLCAASADRILKVKSSMCHIGRLYSGVEVLMQVFKYLPLPDLLRIGQVCKLWHRYGQQPVLWHSIKLRGVIVKNWDTFIKCMQSSCTKKLDARGFIPTSNREESWQQLQLKLPTVTSLEQLEVGHCTPQALYNITDKLPALWKLNAESLVGTLDDQSSDSNAEMDFEQFRSLAKLTELRVRGLNRLKLSTESNLGALGSLTNLKKLSLMTLNEVPCAEFRFLGSLVQLEALELGECPGWDSQVYSELGKLTKLRTLRIESGGEMPDPGLGKALLNFTELSTLELIHFVISEELSEAMPKLKSLQALSIWPNIKDKGEVINRHTMNAVSQMKFLKNLDWGIIIYSSFISTDTISIQKEVPSSGEGADQTETLHIKDLRDHLSNCLPDSKIRVFKVPMLK